MILAYCKTCREVIAAGDLSDRVKVRGRKTSLEYSHAVAGARHLAVLVPVDDTPQEPDETPGAYLIRLASLHKDKLP